MALKPRAARAETQGAPGPPAFPGRPGRVPGARRPAPGGGFERARGPKRRPRDKTLSIVEAVLLATPRLTVILAGHGDSRPHGSRLPFISGSGGAGPGPRGPTADA